MKSTHLRCASVSMIAAAVLTGCDDVAAPLQPEQAHPVPIQSTTVRQGPFTIDDEFAEIARTLPGRFGGLFLDEDGIINVYLADRAREAEALTALAPVLAARSFSLPGRMVDPSNVRVRTGNYEYSQLVAWRDLIRREIMGLDGLTLLDIDEVRNRLRIGISDLAFAERVEAELTRVGIPRQAVLIEQVAPSIDATTLRDQVRPIPGGVKVEYRISFPYVTYVDCTLGFNAKLTDFSSEMYFVTNSHCTEIAGGEESTVFYQPDRMYYNQIGVEYSDPNYFVGGSCPGGKRCRYSDAALVKYLYITPPTVGYIARTEFAGLYQGSITIPNFGGARFRLTGEKPYPSVGDVVQKMGQVTGWTEGRVVGTCVDRDVQNSNRYYLCQDIVNAGVDNGDSGSPVFGFSGSQVLLTGIVRGWYRTASGIYYEMSSLGNIELELGPLITF